MTSKVAFSDPRNNLIRYGKKCYTEDQILIYTLYISNIPESVSSSSLKTYFSQFGEVETLTYKNMYKTSSGNRHRAILTFKSPDSASKTLIHRFHKINDSSLAVRGADSWIQPHKKRVVPFPKIDDSDTNNFHILKLNDYTLFNVFSCLSFQDQVHFSAICERFKKIFVLMYKKRKCLHLDSKNISSLSLLEIYESFTTIGKFIEVLKIDGHIQKFNRIYDFILKYFPNLRILHLENVNKKYCNSNKEIALHLKKLTHLTIKNCCVNDKQIKKFLKLDRLEYFDISDNVELVGKHLHNFKKLRHICLNNCEKLETSNLKLILEKIPLKTLKVIGIRNADAIGSPTFRSENLELEEFHFTSYRPENSFLKTIPTFKSITKIRMQLIQLERDDTGLRDFFVSCVENKRNTLQYLGLISQHLDLNAHNIDNLVQLKDLKELEINRLTNADCLFWTKLCMLNQLEVLNFYCEQEVFDENEFLSWMSKSKNIKTITAKFEKKIIKIDFISSAIDILKQLNTNAHKTKLNIFNVLKKNCDDGNENILSDVKYLANRHLICVTLSESAILDDEINLNNLRESQLTSIIDNII